MKNDNFINEMKGSYWGYITKCEACNGTDNRYGCRGWEVVSRRLENWGLSAELISNSNIKAACWAWVAKNFPIAFILGVSLAFNSSKIQKLLVIFLYKFQNLISHWYSLIEIIFIFCNGYRSYLYVSLCHKFFFSQ